MEKEDENRTVHSECVWGEEECEISFSDALIFALMVVSLKDVLKFSYGPTLQTANK